jgi:hypothetical protein
MGSHMTCESTHSGHSESPGGNFEYRSRCLTLKAREATQLARRLLLVTVRRDEQRHETGWI